MTIHPNKKIRIAVICGGPSSEREVSLKSGSEILKHIPKTSYETHLIEIEKNGTWLLKNGSVSKEKNRVPEKKLAVVSPKSFPITIKEVSRSFNVAVLALHGRFGEDGKIQSLLELSGIPYTGSGVLASALGMNKAKTRQYLTPLRINTPRWIEVANPFIRKEKLKTTVKLKIGYPCVIKPNESGSSIGVSIVRAPNELGEAVQTAFREDKTILIEEYISGREITCGVIGNTDQTKLIALPPVEIIPDGTFFDYAAKYESGKTKEICPAPIGHVLTRKVKNLAKRIHAYLGCDGLTRSDFILRNGKMYFLEINTIPGMTEQSLCPKEAEAAGMSFSQFLEMQIKLAMLRSKKT